MATAADFPTAFAKAERAAGRPLPTEGTVFLSVRDADKAGRRPRSRPLSRDSASSCSRRAAPPQALTAAGLAVERVRKVSEQGEAATVVDRDPRAASAISSSTLRRAPGHAATATLIREAALAPASPASRRSRARRRHPRDCERASRAGRLSLQERNAGASAERRLGWAGACGSKRSGPYTCSGRARSPGTGYPRPVLHAPPGRAPYCRGHGLCLAPPRELASSSPVGPGKRSLCAVVPGDESRSGPARQRLPARRRAAAARRRRDRRRAAAVPIRGARMPACGARLPQRGHAEAAGLVPKARSWSSRLVTRRCAAGTTCSPAGPSRCCRPSASWCRTRNSPGRRRWPAGTAPATAARSRSTASQEALRRRTGAAAA